MKMVFDVWWKHEDKFGELKDRTCRFDTLQEAVVWSEDWQRKAGPKIVQGLRIKPTIYLEGEDPSILEKYGL